MDLVNKYLNLSEAMFPGSPEYKKKFDSSFNPYDPEGKVKKALKLQPYGYRDKADSNDDEKPTQQPAMKKRGRPKKMSEAMSAVDRIDARFKKLSGRSMGTAAKEYGDEAKRLQKEIDAQAAENERRKAAMKKEEADLDEIAVVKTNKPIGTRVADIGPGGKEYNIKTNKAYDDAKKKNPKGREGGVIKAIDHLAKEEVEPIEELSKTTLASYAKKATSDARLKMATGKDFERIATQSRKPAYKASAATWEKRYKGDARKREAGVIKAIDHLAKEEVEIDERCWDGYTARGMKKKDGRMVPNCVPTTEQNDLVSRYLSRASVHQEAVTYDSGFRKMAPVKDRFGNKVKNVAQHLARQGMQAAIKDLKKGPEASKKQVS